MLRGNYIFTTEAHSMCFRDWPMLNNGHDVGYARLQARDGTSKRTFGTMLHLADRDPQAKSMLAIILNPRTKLLE